MKAVLYHTIYDANPYGHGGEKRTAQLREMFLNKDIEIIDFKPDLKYRLSLRYLFMALNVIISMYGLNEWKSLLSFFRFWKYLSIVIPQLESFFHSDVDTFIWESTKDYYYYLPFLAKKHNKKLIAYPHNLESLVPGENSIIFNRKLPEKFNREIKVLGMCDEVYTISREECLFLKLFNINAFYYPYYPPKVFEEVLLDIKRKRNFRDNGKEIQILMLGSAINPPTREGMENRINFFQILTLENIKLKIGGYGTHHLKDKIKNKNIILLGELSSEQLYEEMINTDALLIFQPATTGALTRIREFLIAGIPVIANEDSGRSYYEDKDIFIYRDDEHLCAILDLKENFKNVENGN
ncbi:glycosyltransferase family 1 protein [Paludibacter sp. 221]|uniref:glycosyltransferase n=1 Tax=Paludibacter sp. 221 TaxID=2302939 RepID=UPI0013D36CD9|nr:glycosyltransferase [Paludibacter sp. 221]NDV46032.1 glycosyltransferase family 1 protein [Paludibacter sp. 221]